MSKYNWSIPDASYIGGVNSISTASADSKKYLWAGTVTYVDYETMVCSVVLNSGHGEIHDIPIPAPSGSGPRSWSGGLIEKHSKVVLGWKKSGRNVQKPYIIEIMTPGTMFARDYEPFSSADPSEVSSIADEDPSIIDESNIKLETIRLKSRKLYPGEHVISSSGGSEILVDNNVSISNRSGNEINIRDSDQTIILQSVNEYRSTSAGFYKSGLIKRNAFNLLKDLFYNGDIISPGYGELDSVTSEPVDRHPAYNILYKYGLINENGEKSIPDSENSKLYPSVTLSDGQNVSYITNAGVGVSFNDTPYSYVEDRKEIKHISDGIQSVTDEGEGFQVDPMSPVFIESVLGTVVGNDFQTDHGRSLYKRILTMKVFNNSEQAYPSTGPIFEPVDTIDKINVVDDQALASLFKIQSPNSSNQYVHGITKEGRVLCIIPKSKSGEVGEKGKSVDLSVEGLIKSVIGHDEGSGNKSLDLKMTGGANIEIGRQSDGTSVNLVLKGKIRKTHLGNDANGSITNEDYYGGSIVKSVTGSDLTVVGGSQTERVIGEKSIEAGSVAISAGSSGYKNTSLGDRSLTVVGKTNETYQQQATLSFSFGKKQTIYSGIDDTTVIAGSKSTTVNVGNCTTTVNTGSMSSVVNVGNYSMKVDAGNMEISVGAGNLSISNNAGPISINSSLSISLTAVANVSINAPSVKIGAAAVGFAVAGIPGPMTPAIDYVTGIPLLGIPTVTLG